MAAGCLIDTHVRSELRRPKPDPGVLRWFEQLPGQQLHLSVLSLGEPRRGVERLEPGTRRARLERWLEQEPPL